MTSSQSKADQSQHRTVLTRYGIRMTALLIGSLGKFDMTTLLLQLTTSLSLIAIATVMVDYAAIYALKDRKRYKEAKYEKTEAFGQDLFGQITHASKSGNTHKVANSRVYESTAGDGDEPLLSAVN